MDARFRAPLAHHGVRAPLLALVAVCLWLAACMPAPARQGSAGAAAAPGGTAVTAAAPSGSAGGASTGAASADGAAASASASAEPVPEKDTLNVAVAAVGSTSLPLQVAIDAGYFRNRGLTVNLSVLAASVAVQALISGSIDLYQGGATAIAGRLGGADIIYVGAAVDRSSLLLLGQKGITTFPDLRGKGVATTSVGAFGEIALHQTAKEFGMVPGQDFEVRYHPGPDAAAATFTSGATAGVIITPPQSLMLADEGYPVIFDYYQRGLRITGPGLAVMGPFARENPNTLKAYMRSYLDGVKRTFEDREYATAVNAKYTGLQDPQALAQDYDISSKVWNKDLRVSRGAIEIVLQNSPLPNAATANPDDFYDNSLIDEVNATYANKLFPDVFAQR
ncbi:MAG TPA: ABC transporter substrate-binding protein [Chloroflexota bacterium]|nr:ABC transporter substrate-binding protein [Chloroflexota bacterium]